MSSLFETLAFAGKCTIHSHGLHTDRILDRCEKLACRVDQFVTDFVDGVGAP